MADAKYTIALAGNPNSGKTTFFNRLTGSNQKVGNWPGVTIDKKVGTYTKKTPGKDEKETVNVVDLPGIYSLTPYSEEEIIARNFIVDENPDLVIDIVDATNLERNLYLTFELKKLGCPIIVALNMMDEVEQNGTRIDFDKMSEMLGVPVIPISAIEGKSFSAKVAKLMGYKSSKVAEGGVERLIQKTNDILDHSYKFYGDNPEAIPASGEKEFSGDAFEKKKFDPSLLKHADEINYDAHSAEIYDEIGKIVSATVREGEKTVQQDRTKKIDNILTNKWLGIPIFLVLMFIVFELSFTVGGFFTDWIDVFFNETLAGFVEEWFESAGTADWMADLVINGIIAGVGGVLTFVPQIFILFVFLTLMEDTGYMARVAFLLDRIFKKIGLSGKSFIPLILGFGCSVPAVMAARTLDNEMDRKTTIFITPFMSCGARLPIYALFVGVFFTAYYGLTMLFLYVLGILVAIASAWLLKKTIFKGPSSPFIMELPPYRFPDLYTYAKHIWEKTRGFVIRAGTIIFLASVLIWFLQGYDFSFAAVEDSADSILGVIGNFIAPIFEPLGFGDWRAAMSLFTGFIAKEAVVSTIEILYTPEDFEMLFTPVIALAFMVFTLLYLPCLAAFATIKRELNSWKLAILAAVYQTAVAYVVAFVVYRIGLLVVQYLI
ncbi:Fe(2+) transporter FeoB [Methanimicrococcus hongohii]|uniref:Ferrous iron transport protein B n=1 Tax=Methanimicrococcus hongohii TaxID=3028295 RepID=A0AA96UZ14_9EURY|nr:ferrous iron transport protein B [Methanimicrococcus sp. Hf6]WNY23249.1 Fe(2+) transporter FeoB [Methanimicrococcus sp. Hf6]